MIRYTASEETKKYAETASDEERFAIFEYVSEGWETGWSYPNRPDWLKDKYPDKSNDR